MKTSKKIGFILGRDQALSVAEIFAVLARKGIKYTSPLLGKDFLILELDNPDIRISDFGGTIKLFEVLGEYTSSSEIVDNLYKLMPFESEKRINFGLSGYGKLNKKFVLDIGYGLKSRLTDSGYSSRFVTGKHLDLSSVIVTENKLLERGLEALIIKTGSAYLLGRTMAVQDYKAYSKRDFGRPNRDDRNGMLPPKLAQIMVNLAQKPLDASVYDPFCGSGTVLQEALLLGYNNISGSDIDPKNVEDTKENLNWLINNVISTGAEKSRYLDLARGDRFIFVSDVLEAGSLKLDAPFDAIVAEGYLGEPVRKSKNERILEAKKLADFYLAALENLNKILENNGNIVLAIPFYIDRNEYIYLPLLDQLAATGYEIVKPLPREININLRGRGNLTYSRPDQFVGREILILKKSR